MSSAVLVGQLPFSAGTIYLALLAGVVMLFFFALAVPLSRRFKRCPSNAVLVVYGKTGRGTPASCIHGGAAFVWPLIQDYAYLSLEPMQIEVPLRGALSMENIRVSVPSVFTVAIGTTPEVMQNAAIRLLGLTREEIKKQAEDIIFGQLRQVIASMKIEDINRDRDKFLENIQSNLEPELKKIGLVLINVNITDITDESGYIEAIGRKAASQAVQQARGDVAEQEKLGEVRVAAAERDQAVQVAEANKEREIGTRAALRDQAVRVAELEKDREIGTRAALRDQAVRIAEMEKEQQVGEQTARFQRDVQVKDAERESRVAISAAEAKAIEGENQARAVIASSKAELAVREAEAYQLGETKKREAEAAVLEAQNLAMAKAALADAQRVEAEQRAALEAKAKAEKAKTIVEAEAAAERRRIEAAGEAAAIFARLDAEARGQYEILAKKGEGLQRIIEACGGAQQAFQLLMLEHLDTLADTAAKAISNIKFDKVIVWENGGSNGQSSTAGFLKNMAHALPPMMQVMREIGGLELPEALVKMTDGATDGAASPTTAARQTPPAAEGDRTPPKSDGNHPT